MGNVLSEDKKHQVVALGRLAWSLRRIEEATEVRRETASGSEAAGIPVRAGADGRGWASKTGHHAGGVHRLPGKTGNFRGGVHRVGTAKTGQQAPRFL